MAGSSTKGLSPAVIAHDKCEERTSERNHEIVVAADSREDEAKFTKAKTDREVMIADIANRTEEDKNLTAEQTNAIKKNPAIRMLIRKEFTDRGIDTHKIFVDVVEESYKVGMGKKMAQGYKMDEDGKVVIIEGIPVREDIKLKNRRMVANTVTDLEGLELRAVDKDRAPTTIILQFDGAFANNDNATIEIGIRATPGSNSNNPGSPPQPVHNRDLRDKEWENPPCKGDSEVLAGKTGKTG